MAQRNEASDTTHPDDGRRLRRERDLAFDLAGLSDRRDVAARVLAAMGELEGVDAAGVYLRAGAEGHMELVTSENLPSEIRTRIALVAPGSPQHGFIRDANAYHGRYAELRSRLGVEAEGETFRGVSAVPVMVEGRGDGLLNAACRDRPVLPEETCRALESYAGLLGRVLERLPHPRLAERAEEYARLAVEHSSEGIAVSRLDPEGHTICVVYCNERFAELAGRPRSELLEVGDIRRFVAIADFDQRMREWTAELLQGNTVRTTGSWLRPDGRENVFEAFVVPVTFRGVAYHVTAMRDLTEDRAAFARLRESEERYRMLFEHVPAALVVTRTDGTVIACNAFALDMTGFERHEAVGRNIVGFHPREEDRQKLLAVLQNDWPRAGPVEVRVRTREGEERLVSLSMARMKLEGQDVIVGMSSDLTDQRRHEQMLERTLVELRRLADNAAAPIVRLDPQFRVVFGNRRLVEVLGRPLEEILGKTARELGHPEEVCDLWEQAQRRAQATGQSQVLEFSLPTPDGVRHYTETMVAETGPDGRPLGVLTIARDITEEVEAREALEVEHAALRQSHIALRELTARVDQEKREVSQAVRKNVEHAVMPILESLSEELAPDQRTYVGMIRNALADVVSPFADRLASEADSLSPAELRVAILVRNRLTSKKIAELLGISVSTVHRHRESIRRKLGLTGKAANLVTFLDAFLDEPRLARKDRGEDEL